MSTTPPISVDSVSQLYDDVDYIRSSIDRLGGNVYGLSVQLNNHEEKVASMHTRIAKIQLEILLELKSISARLRALDEKQDLISILDNLVIED